MKTSGDRIEILICDCHSTEHQILLMHEYEQEIEDGVVKSLYPMCYMHTHLNKHTFWTRIKYGIKYIFGYQCKYGAFDEFIFNPEDAPKLQNLVDHLNEQRTYLTI